MIRFFAAGALAAVAAAPPAGTAAERPPVQASPAPAGSAASTPPVQASPAPAGSAAELPALTISAAAGRALRVSPDLRGLREELGLAALEEPALLAETDPVFSAQGTYFDDRSPRALPVFQGTFARGQQFETALTQKLLIGTEAKLSFKGLRVVNPALFRALDPTVDTRLAFEIKQPLLKHFWGRPDKARRGKARAGVRGAEARIARLGEEIATQTGAAYLEAWFAMKQVEVRRAARDDAAALLADYRRKRPYNLVEETDLLQAESSLEFRKINLRTAEAQREIAFRSLKSLVTAGRGEAFRIVEPAGLAPPPFETEAALATAREKRADLTVARAQVERSSWSLRVERLGSLPNLSLIGSAAFAGLDSGTGGSLSDLGGFGHPVLSGGLAISVPLRSKRERIRIQDARRRLSAARAGLEAVERDVDLQVRSALDRLKEAASRTEATERLLELERKKLAAGREDYDRGRIDTDLLIRLMSDVRTAEVAMWRARTDRVIAVAELALATGTVRETLGI